MKQGLKRFFTALLAITLYAVPAGAVSVREQTEAPWSYQNTYYSNTSRTAVTVDASVYVPEVEEIPSYAVTVRDFTVQEGIRLAQLLHPDKTWELDASMQGLPDDEFRVERYGSNNQRESAFWMAYLPRPDRAYVRVSNSYVTGVFTRQPDYRTLKYQWADPETNLFFYPNAWWGHPETQGKTLQGQRLTVEEATAMANHLIDAFAPDYELRTVFGVEGEKGDGKVYDTLAYCFFYTRTVGGVPITYADYSHVTTEFLDTAMAPAPGQEYITLAIHQDRIVNFIWQDPYEIGERIPGDTALLPFEKIMDIFGRIAPLSVQFTETSTGNNGMHITEIRLGYMPVLCEDNPNQWELRPVWDFMGSRILPLETYDTPCYSLLTLDAREGTVIDRNYGY